jgi:hypothetical protein
MMGMTGYRKGKDLTRMIPLARFAAFEGGPTTRRRAAAAAAAMIVKKKEESDGSGGEGGRGVGEISESSLSLLAQATLDKIDAASRRPMRDYVESRQGTAMWSALSREI